ncbi:hypothetical protein B0H11DRAFT_2030482 [Mycena galericulata]|nr:hypothetical protein B0H11DRAFT_2030482 [Mycena galericulata]
MTILVSDRHVDLQLVDAFLGLQIGAGLGLSILVWTALGSNRVKRNPTWYSFCAAWIVSCISYTFIFLVGQQESPNFGVCVTQAAGIYSAPSLTGCATLAFSIDMLFGVRAASTNLPRKHISSINIALLIIPYLIWICLFIGFLVFGLHNPAMVQKGPNGTYCDLSSFTPSKISGLLVVVQTVSLLAVQGYIGSRLIRKRNFLKNSKLLPMAIRIMVFSLMAAIGLGIGFAYVLFSERAPVFDIMISILPASAVVIFGTQMDLVNVWLFRVPVEDNDKDDDLKSTSSTYVQTPRPEDLNVTNKARAGV